MLTKQLAESKHVHKPAPEALAHMSIACGACEGLED